MPVRKIKYPCNQCQNPVAKSHRGILCDVCHTWVHAKCNNTSIDEYIRISASNQRWSCRKCILANIPYSYLPTDSILKLNKGKPASSVIENNYVDEETQQFFQAMASQSSSESDETENPLSNSWKYFTPQELKTTTNKKNTKTHFST